MNFINRAFKNVTRRLSKTILLTLTFFLIGNLVIVGLGISKASESAKILTRQKMRAVVTYMLDYDKIWQYADTIEDEDELNKFYEDYPRIKLEDVTAFLADERVKTANALSTNMWYSDHENSLDFVHLNNEAEKNMDSNGQACWMLEDGTQQCEDYKEPMFLARSNMFPSMIEFEDGDYEVTQGRFYNQSEINNADFVCLISENLAAVNGLSIGDTIRLASNYNSPFMKEMGVTEEDITSEFEIIGIYDHHHPITPDNSNYDYCYPYENPDNMILMPTTTVYAANLTLNQKNFDYYAAMYAGQEGWEYYDDESNRPSMENMEKNNYIDNVVLLLSDPLEVDKFADDYKDSLGQFARLDLNNDEFNKLAKPLDTLSMYANFIVRLVVINAIVIITLVTALTLKNREYEIGVLLSVGASKFKVVAQFFVELALVAILGFTLSVVSGSLIARRIGNTVLEYQITASDLEEGYSYRDDDYFSIWETDYTEDISMEDLISEYEVTVSPALIAEIYVLGLGIVLISVIIPSFMIMRYNPKKILMNQN